MVGGTTKVRGRWQAAAGVMLLLALTATSSWAQNSTQNFSAFYARFRTAVAHKDEAALKTMMDPHFAFLRAENVPPPVVFQALAADGGLQWANLQQAVRQQPAVYQGKDAAQVGTRILMCTPTQVIYNCLVVFNQDSQGRWKWKGMVQPPA